MADFPPNLSIRPLTVEDLDQCIELEKKGFSEEERASPEKLKYRLVACPELCSGLFIREYGYKFNTINLPLVAQRLEDEKEGKADSSNDEKSKDKGSDNSKGQWKNEEDLDDDDEESYQKLPVKLSVVKETLIGHITATKIGTEKVKESSMAIPTKTDPHAGHIEASRIIAIHGLVIDPEWQGKNLGTLLMHDYIQKLSNQDLGSKVAILAHKELIPFYEKIGFVEHGESDCKFAGETWYDLSIDLVPQDED